MLRVVSQDGKASIPYDKVHAHVVSYNDGCEIVFMNIFDENKSCTVGATYSAEEQARLALAEMDEAWTLSDSKNHVYRLPDDETLSKCNCRTCGWSMMDDSLISESGWGYKCMNKDTSVPRDKALTGEDTCDNWQER